MAAGVARERIWLDPGIGFGKHMLRHNLPLMAGLDRTSWRWGSPSCWAPAARPSSAHCPAASDADHRLGGSIAADPGRSASAGVAAVRVHDVAETVQALNVQAAIAGAERLADLLPGRSLR